MEFVKSADDAVSLVSKLKELGAQYIKLSDSELEVALGGQGAARPEMTHDQKLDMESLGIGEDDEEDDEQEVLFHSAG
jgi:hypothetical protein